MASENAVQMDHLPTPVGYRILVQPVEIEEVTSGGIVLVAESRDYAREACPVYRVIKKGADCYKDKLSQWCNVGDHIIIDRHAGQNIEVKGTGKAEKRRYRLINDEDVRAKVEDPNAIMIYVDAPLAA